VTYQPTPHLLIDADGPVTVLTLNNPEKLNSFLDDMHVAIHEVWAHLTDDSSVRVVVITGAGRAFSAGGTVPDFVRTYEDPEYRQWSMRGARRMLDAMAAFPKPVVAAVNGPAIGLGWSVANMADLVYMGRSAFLQDPHVSIGLVAGDGGAATWPLMMSLHKAKEYLLLGDRISAEEAVRLGLANKVLPDDELMPAALAVAHRLAAQPPQAVQETKRALNLHLQAAINLVEPFALAAESESFSTPELKASVERFVDGEL
jgi:enoyl-CoA hydratase